MRPVLISGLHAYLNVNWAALLNDYRPPAKRKVVVAYIPVTCPLTCPVTDYISKFGKRRDIFGAAGGKPKFAGNGQTGVRRRPSGDEYRSRRFEPRMLRRAYLDLLSDGVAIFAIPGARLEAYLQRIETLAKANTVLAKFHDIRRRAIEDGKTSSIQDSLVALNC